MENDNIMKTEVLLHEATLFLIAKVNKPRCLAISGGGKLIPNWPTIICSSDTSNPARRISNHGLHLRGCIGHVESPFCRARVHNHIADI